MLEYNTEKGAVTLDNREIVHGMSRYQSELYVLEKALTRINTMCELHIYIECDYVAAGFEQGWIEKWNENNWTTSSGKEVSNKREWIALEQKMKPHQFYFHTKEEHSYRNWLKNNVEKEKLVCLKNLENSTLSKS